MSLYIAVITYIMMIVLLSCIRAVYPLVLFAFLSIFISLSINSLFDSAGTMATTTFTTVAGTVYTQSNFMTLLYIVLTMMIFAKVGVMKMKKKGEDLGEGN